MKISGRIGKKIYINELGHITKMAAFKALQAISFRSDPISLCNCVIDML